MRYDFAVVGANGMQGKIVARDLLESGYSVLLCATDDLGLERLLEQERAGFAVIDLKTKVERVRRIVKNSGAQVIVNCSCDDFNLKVTKLALDLGVHYIDLGSEEDMTREQSALHNDFRAKNVLAISGIGSTPGINNIMLRYVKDSFDTVDTVHLGFAWDSNMPHFVPPFSIDAIQYEFTEPAKILENGSYVEKSPLEPTKLDYYYKTIGRQHTCYTKHIEHHTFYDFLKDKGVKDIVVFSSFPSHSYTAIRKMIELGFLNKEPIEVNGVMIRPLDFTIEVLRRIPMPEGYTEKENIWLKVYGTKDGQRKVEEMDCIAGTMPGWEDATCNVDTGFPASILAQMIIKGEIAERGFFSPEFVVDPGLFFERLGDKKLYVYRNGKKINGDTKSAARTRTLSAIQPIRTLQPQS